MNTHCTRDLQLDATRADAKRRRIPAVISSETPVARDGYNEVLRHDANSIDLSRAPLPLLESHDGSRLNIGLVENLRIDGRTLRGDVVLGNSTRANELWPDIEAGVVRNLSIGYRIDDYEQRGASTIEATRWTPHEVSLVAVPADPAAGTYRSFAMNENETLPAGDAGEHLSRSQRRAMNTPDAAAIAVEAERNRVADINAGVDALAKYDGVRSLGNRAIAEGWNVDQFRKASLDVIASKSGPMTLVHVGDRFLPQGGERQFSLVRALRGMLDPQSVDAGFEREVSQELALRMGRKPRGFFMPMGSLQMRDLTVSGAPAMVGTTHLAGAFIDALRARSVVMNLGPTILSGLTDSISIPRLATSATSAWIAGDGSDGLTASTPGFDAVTLNPKTVGGLVNISRKMVLQGNPEAELTVRNDLAQVIATALDVAALQGSGASNQPTGITNTSGVTADTFAGAAPTFAEIVGMEGDLLAANVDTSRAAYVTTPALAVSLKTTAKASNQALFIWEAGAEPGVGVMNGLRAFATANVPAGKVILGNFADLVMGLWGAVDIEVNPYADFAKGTVSVRAFASVDFGVRHAKSFAVYSTP